MLNNVFNLIYYNEASVDIADQDRFKQILNQFQIQGSVRESETTSFANWTVDEMMKKFCKPTKGQDGFVCMIPKCSTVVKHYGNMKTHFRDVHIEADLFYICPKCQKPTRGQNGFRMHKSSCHPELAKVPYKDILPEPISEKDLEALGFKNMSRMKRARKNWSW